MAKDKLYNEIRAMIAEIAEEEEEKIPGDAKFVEDLGMDSMMALEILAALEKKYKIQVPEGKILEMQTLNKVVALARELMPKK